MTDKMKRKILLLLILTFPVILSFAQTATFSDSAAVYFRELQTNTSRYRELWNLDIYGPVLLVDPGSGKILM
jgi:hypothetical protein